METEYPKAPRYYLQKLDKRGYSLPIYEYTSLSEPTGGVQLIFCPF